MGAVLYPRPVDGRTLPSRSSTTKGTSAVDNLIVRLKNADVYFPGALFVSFAVATRYLQQHESQHDGKNWALSSILRNSRRLMTGESAVGFLRITFAHNFGFESMLWLPSEQ
jgi:hypothetical protein